jgi:hypothetical protein
MVFLLGSERIGGRARQLEGCAAVRFVVRAAAGGGYSPMKIAAAHRTPETAL